MSIEHVALNHQLGDHYGHNNEASKKLALS